MTYLEDLPTLRKSVLSFLNEHELNVSNITGAVVTGNSSTSQQGQWQFSSDQGNNWSSIPTNLNLDGSSVLVLSVDTLIRFTPASNFNGTPGILNLNPLTQSNLDWATSDQPYGNRGGSVVVWDSYWQDGSNRGVYGQRFDSNGSKAGSEFLINTYTDNDQYHSSVSSLADGGFVVT